jgi:RNA polymerase primary sigma factor
VRVATVPAAAAKAAPKPPHKPAPAVATAGKPVPAGKPVHVETPAKLTKGMADPTPAGKSVATKVVKTKSGKESKGAERIEAAALPPSTPEDRQSQLKLLIGRGKEQGFLTYAEVNDHLPSEIVDPEQIEDIVQMINDMGIPVYEKAPDAEALLLREPVVADDEAAEEAAAALATTVDAEFGRTTDPVRMYMREMGTVELLTREGEIRIAKRIEKASIPCAAHCPLPATYDRPAHLRTREGRPGPPVDIIVGLRRSERTRRDCRADQPKLAAAAKAGRGRRRTRKGEEGSVDTGPDPEEAARASPRWPCTAGSRRSTRKARGTRRRSSCAASWPTSSWNSSSRRACSSS